MAEVAVIKTAAEQQLAAGWQEAKSRLPGPTLLRATAFERFAAAGLPHRRVEEWEYTDLRALMRDSKPLAAGRAPPPRRRRGRGRQADQCSRRAASCWSTGRSCRTCPTSPAWSRDLASARWRRRLPRATTRPWRSSARSCSTDDIAVALNTAFMGDGAVI